MATLLLARHGETDWNRDHKWQGSTGPGLNDRGRRQAVELAGRLRSIDAVYSSDSERARETAAVVAAWHGLSVRTDERLRELDFGEWEGLTRHEIDRLFDGAFTRWASCEGPHPATVETDEALAARVLDALHEIAERHGDGRVLIVTSGGPIRAARAHLRGIDQTRSRRLVEPVANCALVELVIRAGVWEAAS
jgi:broad specificity phosphatase PhoE